MVAAVGPVPGHQAWGVLAKELEDLHREAAVVAGEAGHPAISATSCYRHMFDVH